MKLLTWLVRAALVLAALGCCFPSKESSTPPAPTATSPSAEAGAASGAATAPAAKTPEQQKEDRVRERVKNLTLPPATEEKALEILSPDTLMGAVVTSAKTLPKCQDKKGWSRESTPNASQWSCKKLDPKTSDFKHLEFYTNKDNRIITFISQSTNKDWAANYIKTAVDEKCSEDADQGENKISFSCPHMIITSQTEKEKSTIIGIFSNELFDIIEKENEDIEWMEGPQFKDAIQLGDFSYKILSAQKMQKIGNQYVGAKATPGGTFAVIKYRIENTANETKTVLSDDFELHDYKGRIFRPSANALTALAVESDGELILRELQPGLAVERSTAFEIPLDSIERPRKLKVVVPEKGLMGTEKVEFEVWFP